MDWHITRIHMRKLEKLLMPLKVKLIICILRIRYETNNKVKPKGIPIRKVDCFVLYSLKKIYTRINANATQDNSIESMSGRRLVGVTSF